MSGSAVSCAACVMLAVLAARGINASATASASTRARGIAAPFTPRPAAAQQLGPPTPAVLPTAASNSVGEDRMYHGEEVAAEPAAAAAEPAGLLRTITTQVRLNLSKTTPIFSKSIF